MADKKQRYRVRMTTSRGTFWMGRSPSDGVCGWVRGTGGASHYQMLSAATKAAQQRWLDITSVFGDVRAIDVVNDQGELVWRGSRDSVSPSAAMTVTFDILAVDEAEELNQRAWLRHLEREGLLGAHMQAAYQCEEASDPEGLFQAIGQEAQP